MIKITIKVSNDHCSLSEHFESTTLLLDTSDGHLKSMIDSVIDKFNQPVEEVIVKTRMVV